jgi:phospholipase C
MAEVIMLRGARNRSWRRFGVAAGATAAAALPVVGASSLAGAGGLPGPVRQNPAEALSTATPIKHVVVIFQENVSFDHYFGTYPYASNTDGEPFHGKPGTPSVNGLTASLLSTNPDSSNPQRLDPSQAMTCDQDHGYTAEQGAFDHGLMDQFVKYTGGGLTLAQCLANEYQGNGDNTPTPPVGPSQDPANDYAVMDYYDGNTVTALWNYAQSFALSDNFYGTDFGPSTPGALNVTSTNNYGVTCGPASATYWPGGAADPEAGGSPASAAPRLCSLGAATPETLSTGEAPGGAAQPPGPGTDFSDADPYLDVCSYVEDGDSASQTMEMSGPNIGDLLNQAGVTWGWFEGGFDDGYVPGHGTQPTLSQICSEQHKNLIGNQVNDYVPHHEPFQYHPQTANPLHLPPTSVAMIGQTDQANHQYDLADFWAAADSGNLPAVSYIKAPAYEDGHAGYSDPIGEQRFLVSTINQLERLPTWRSTAVFITWDDSDGWYDHQVGPIQRYSQTSLDSFSDPGLCGANASLVPLSASGAREQARCGVGPRIPLLVISPYAKSNFVDNTFTDQSSIVQFIEDNWLGGKRLGGGAADATAGSLDNNFDFSHPVSPPLFLDRSTGEPVGGPRP